MMGRFLPSTLRARLTALILLSTALVLSASGLALCEALKEQVDASTSGQMRATMSALRTHLSGRRSPAEIRADAGFWIDQLHGHRNLDLGIYDMAGNQLVSTPRFQYDAFVMSPKALQGSSMLMRPGSAFRYLVTIAPLEQAGAPAVRIVLQYDSGDDQALLRRHAYMVLIIEVLGVALAATLAYGIALVGLSPLRRLVARAEQMSTNDLAQPLPELGDSGELKELGHAFNGMLSRLNDSFTRLSQFSSNLAHDMRTPLTNLQAAAQVALSQPRTAEEYRDVIVASIDEYKRLSRMADDMLFLARSDRAEMSISIRVLDAVREAERVAGYYETIAEDASVTIEVTGHGNVCADLLLYQRALSNLLSNALSHAPKGSTITVHCQENDDATAVFVSDTGPGIDAAHLERVFERFYRVDPSRHHSGANTGLGLAIVKSIMQNHRGQCGVQSKPNVRTTFWLQFPHEIGRGAATL